MTFGSAMTVACRPGESCALIEVKGELDLTNTPSLDEAIAAADAPTVILDLAGLEYVDSAGLRTVDQAHRRLAEAGRTLLVVAPAGSRAAWTFRVAGYPEDFAFDSAELAQQWANSRD